MQSKFITICRSTLKTYSHFPSFLSIKYWSINLEAASANTSGGSIFVKNSLRLHLDVCNIEVYIWGQAPCRVSGKEYSRGMIHLTYFRYLREDEKNHALELSISTSLSVENSLHCQHHRSNAANPPLNAKTNYPGLCLCSLPTAQNYNHREAQKL